MKSGDQDDGTDDTDTRSARARTQEALSPFGFATSAEFTAQQRQAVPIPRGVSAMPLPTVPRQVGGLLEQMAVDSLSDTNDITRTTQPSRENQGGGAGSLLLTVAAIASALGAFGTKGRGGGGPKPSGGRGGGGGFFLNYSQRINQLAGLPVRRKQSRGSVASSNDSPGG